MNEQSNEARSLTLKGLRTVIIFYFVLFLISVFGRLGFAYFGTYNLYLYIGVIAILFSLLMIYLGIQDIYKGNTEFSPEHQKNVLFSKKLIFWGTLIFFIGVFVGSIFRESILTGSDFIYAFIQTIIFIPFWLALIYLIKEITSKNIINLLWVAFVTKFILDFTVTLSNQLSITDKSAILVEYHLPITIIALMPSLVFIYCYYITYTRLKNQEI